MTPTSLHISINRENDGRISICKSLKETEEQEVKELKEEHGDEAKLLKFVTVTPSNPDTAASIDAVVTLMETNGDRPGSLQSVFEEILNLAFELGQEFPK